MFKESKEGQTHFYGDGCGEPEHNTPCETCGHPPCQNSTCAQLSKPLTHNACHGHVGHVEAVPTLDSLMRTAFEKKMYACISSDGDGDAEIYCAFAPFKTEDPESAFVSDIDAATKWLAKRVLSV